MRPIRISSSRFEFVMVEEICRSFPWDMCNEAKVTQKNNSQVVWNKKRVPFSRWCTLVPPPHHLRRLVMKLWTAPAHEASTNWYFIILIVSINKINTREIGNKNLSNKTELKLFLRKSRLSLGARSKCRLPPETSPTGYFLLLYKTHRRNLAPGTHQLELMVHRDAPTLFKCNRFISPPLSVILPFFLLLLLNNNRFITWIRALFVYVSRILSNRSLSIWLVY